jgi:hypothetical protein
MKIASLTIGGSILGQISENKCTVKATKPYSLNSLNSPGLFPHMSHTVHRKSTSYWEL